MTITATTRLGALKVAEMLGLSRSNVQAMAQAGTIPAFRFGKSYRFIRAEIEAFIKAQRIALKGEEPWIQHSQFRLPRQPSP